MGDALGLRLAAPALVNPDGGQPVVGKNGISSRVACHGLKRIGSEPHAFRGVLFEPVGYMVFSLRHGTDVGPAHEARIP